MDIQLEPVPIEQKSVLRNLMELCIHDYSEFNGDEIGEHGLYGYKYVDHYWTESERTPWFVRVNGKLAGFALVRTWQDGSEDTLNSLAEYFILRRYRRQGVGGEVARRLFGMYPGKWHVGQESGNIPAQAFWKKVIGDFTRGAFEERAESKGPVLVFQSPPPTPPH